MFRFKTRTFKHLLVGYWLVAPACFYVYLLMTSSMRQVSMVDLMTNVPGITLASLLASLMLIQAVTLYFIQQISSSRDGLLGKFLTFSMIQQLFTGNIVGAILSFFYGRSLSYSQENPTRQQRSVVLVACVVFSMFSLLSLFIAWRLRGG